MVFNRESEAVFDLAVLALPAMMAEFGPEEKAKKLVLESIAKCKTIICKQCTHENKIPSDEKRMFLCSKCRKEIWITAGSNFHGVKLFFLRLAIIRLQEMGICINPNQAARLFRVSYSTTNRVFKQLGISVLSKLQGHGSELPSEYAISIVSRRTRLTPAEKPPVEEEFEMQKKHRNDERAQTLCNGSEINTPELSELELLILELLDSNPLTLDELIQKTKAECSSVFVSITFLELRGAIEAKDGNRFVRSNSAKLQNKQGYERAQSLAGGFNSFVKDYFQGIGRKNLQIYSSFHWLAYDRKTWSINSLRDLFIAHPYISHQDILDFVTPLTFSIVPRFDSS
jgi:hypothetical protein